METTEAAASTAETADIIQIPAAPDQLPSLRAAALAVSSFRHKQRDGATEPSPPAAEARTSAPQTETPSGDEPAAAAVETPPPGNEATESAEPPAQAPIEPPRSWTAEAKERWQSLPRETQEYLSSREQERDRELRRGQNETAEQRKALDAERQRVEQTRAQYENALPALLATLEQQQAGEFGDIKTIADVEKLAREDWPRYVIWDAQQKRLAAVHQQVALAQQRQMAERQAHLLAFAQRETELFREKVPEVVDPAKAQKLQSDAISMLHDFGLSDDELGRMYRGEQDWSLRDHRLQLIIRDALLYRQAQAAAKTAATKVVPPVQRPGTSQPRGVQQAATVDAASKRLDQTGNVRDATRLLMERRRAAAR